MLIERLSNYKMCARGSACKVASRDVTRYLTAVTSSNIVVV